MYHGTCQKLSHKKREVFEGHQHVLGSYNLSVVLPGWSVAGDLGDTCRVSTIYNMHERDDVH